MWVKIILLAFYFQSSCADQQLLAQSEIMGRSLTTDTGHDSSSCPLWRTSSYSSCYYSSLFWNSTQTLTTDNCEIPVEKPERPTDILWVASSPAGLCYPGQLLTLSFLPIRLPILECAFTSSGVFKLPFGETQFHRNLNREAKIPAAAKGRHALIGRRGCW